MHVSDPPDPGARDYVVPRSSDHASSFPPQQPRPASYSAARNANEGNALAQRGHATPYQAYPQSSPLIYSQQPPPPPQEQQQQQQHPQQYQQQQQPLPNYYSVDPYAQAAFDWTQALDLTQLPTPYEPQGELLREPTTTTTTVGFTNPSVEFTNPLAPPPPPPRPRPLPQRPSPSMSPAMKRKSQADAPDEAKRIAVSRASSSASHSPAPPATTTAKGTGPQGREMDVVDPRRVVEAEDGATMLPAGRVFPIQIGSALYRLSGASLCSDAPSYFSHFFAEQLHAAAGRAADIRTLYIDRDPDTFRDIALHLQGYHVVPRDGEHFVKLFADAQFYSLPRLTKQLFKSDIFIAIGGTPFRVPRDSFAAPGNSPNYFTLGFAQWFSTPAQVFPGLDRNALLRPPSISPPAVPNKSSDVFAELMKMLMGYEVDIKSAQHRANLLKDARYFHFKGLEQRLIHCEKSYNLKKRRNEMLIRLEDIRQSGVGFLPDSSNDVEDAESARTGSVTYARPYTDDASLHHHLILETSASEPATIHLLPSSTSSSATTAHVSFAGDTLRRVIALLGIVATKAGHDPITSSPFTARLDADTSLVLDGASVDITSNAIQKNTHREWVVRRAHWRLRVESLVTNGEAGNARIQAVLEAVKMEAYTQERGRNAARGFLGA